ncbi:MAG: 4-(cytidine 5'-diphospho)-2-C-methyl-D-erythritol kinase [Actinomyces sp.]|nr:4-(cytidine 5'-diphospho)-2-C-methyl-D-erythritol kinase [Actinomyces sp.]
MREATASAPGKVNLVLRAGVPDSRGYHPLVTVFECVELRETVRVRTTRSPGVRVHTTVRRADGSVDAKVCAEMDALPPARHLAARAARSMQRLAAAGPWAQTAAGVEITVDKRVPVAGGMAGGSADAAATLVACNELWDLGLDADHLQALGRTLGADVPACLVGGIALGTGRGDHMRLLRAGEPEPLHGEPESPHSGADTLHGGDAFLHAPTSPAGEAPPGGDVRAARGATCLPSHHWALALSDRGLSTPEFFAALDAAGGPQGGWQPQPVLDPETHGRLVGPAETLAPLLANDLTAPALSLHPGLARTRDIAREAGALGVLLSGSGPTVAALARDGDHAQELAHAGAGAPGVAQVLPTRGPAAGALQSPGTRPTSGHPSREGRR